ncbi:MarR family winged helix-turn-helix transcriptional regulator [Hyphomonas johnsonii]|uniref:MarR family transcriptional regulator n=1 Tax=Hyphomonas johnsonii MHS-2 TaxID=1280950 RepID=A0A059FV01_9PROT|nr:MarR family transcriptional regulator [Hyphomonas johnsonii]KCZ94283.1 MarR family transcriptional regulator [Hyphomonas johnsonii MHS-2]
MTDHNDLLKSLRQITQAIDLYSRRLSKETGLTAPQLLVLQALARRGREKPSEIARAVSLSQGTITSIVDRLSRAGLVTRQRSETDKRVIDVVISAKGSARLADAPEPLQKSFVEAFNALHDWEKTLLVSSVQRIANMMNADGFDAAPILDVGDLSRADRSD